MVIQSGNSNIKASLDESQSEISFPGLGQHQSSSQDNISPESFVIIILITSAATTSNFWVSNVTYLVDAATSVLSCCRCLFNYSLFIASLGRSFNVITCPWSSFKDSTISVVRCHFNDVIKPWDADVSSTLYDSECISSTINRISYCSNSSSNV